LLVFRDATGQDGPALRRLAEASTVYAGDLLLANDAELGEHTCPGGDGVRVAEDDDGPVGIYGLSVRRVPAGVEGLLTGMLVAHRARHWAVDRLLVVDLRYQAAALGADVVTVLARPPMDVFFRHLGARAVGLAAPWGPVAGPQVQLELPV
jgi:hypothetical protein